MDVLEKVHRHFVPSHHNSYRPYILRTESLLFFIGLILASEAMFVSGLYAHQMQMMPEQSFSAVPQNRSESFAQSPSYTASVASAVSNIFSPINSIIREFGRLAIDAGPVVPWILGSITVLLTIAVLFAFFIHIQIQQPEMLYSGALVAGFACTLLVTNTTILGL